MLFTAAGQAQVFLTMMVAGVLCGAVAGTLLRLKALFQAGAILGAALDLLSGLLSGLVIAAGLIISCYGEIRLYGFLGVACGILLYRVTLGTLLARALDAVVCFLRPIAAAVRRCPVLGKLFR